jgi:hypothetical protein
MRSAEYQRGYDAGYKQALLDALRQRQPESLPVVGRDPHWRLNQAQRKLDR